MSKYQTDPDNPLPLYYQVYASLRERIESGEYEPGSSLPAERQLVKDYGVSRITIVKAMDTLEREGFVERQQGRGTFVLEQSAEEATAQPIAIGYVPGSLLHSYFYSIQMGLAEVTMRENCQLHVMGFAHQPPKDLDTLTATVLNGVDGLVVYPGPNKQDLPLYERLIAQNIPFVMVDRYYKEIEADSVAFDEAQASYELTQLLIERGHQRIAIIPHFEVNVSSIRNRIAGYTRCLEDHNLRADDDLLWLDVYRSLRPVTGQKGDEHMTERLHSLIRTHQPTAIIAVNQDVSDRLTYDLMAINHQRVQEVISTNGSQTSELSLEVAAFGYTPPEDCGPFTIATALQPGDILGRQAAELLIGRLNGTIRGVPRRIAVPIEIVVRKDNAQDRKERVTDP